MHTIKVQGDREYPVYTKKEAQEKGISWIHWKDCYPGDWGITDDGYVMECRKRYTTKGSDQVVFAGGRMWVHDTAVLEFEPHLEHGSFYLIKPQHPMEREKRTTRTQTAIMRVAAELVSGTPWNEIPWYDISLQMRPDFNDGRSTYLVEGYSRKLFKSPEIMQELQKKMIQLLDDTGFSDEEVANSYKRLFELCLKDPTTNKPRETPDISNARQILNKITEMKGTDKPRDLQPLADELSVDFSKQITDGVEKEQGKLTAKRTYDD